MMSDYDRLTLLFAPDGTVRIPDADVELAGREEIRARGHRPPAVVACLVQTTHLGTIAELVERNNGIFGRCWCIGCHRNAARKTSAIARSSRTGSAQVALTPRSSLTTTAPRKGGCQYGSPQELPGIKQQREYDKDAAASRLADHLLRTLRAVRVHSRPAGWQARADPEHGGRSDLSLGCLASAGCMTSPTRLDTKLL